LKPKILLATTVRWIPSARLGLALANAGCSVETICPSGHPILKTGVIDRRFKYRGITPLRSFRDAIAKAMPDFIVSGDDLATSHLHHLYSQAVDEELSVRELIERSLGAPQYFSVLDDRASFIRVASEAGARVPSHAALLTIEDLIPWSNTSGFPSVLKASGSSGGSGVRVVRNLDEARQAFHTLQAPPPLARAAKRAVFDRDSTLVRGSLLRLRSVVSAQTFIDGREATSAVFCWKGEVVAGIHFEVLEKSHAAGHATVVRRIEHPEMISATERVVHRLGLSGFHGFDFMLANGTNDAYLIEINPRATQVCHLAFGPGRDLVAGALSALTDIPDCLSRNSTHHDIVALFPQEWLREPSSSYLRSGSHDVPWGNPALVRFCLRIPHATRWRRAFLDIKSR
jgi:Carbamoyl-phosphate synthase L chain, ATP binding domain